ncbi:phage tail tube protein [Streptomyces sp. H27-C3]|uniref:phage tail tube protein n=1 Tax=Streptomyces sp. H27-C3 TaxID=3046305 RepID=UPI0024B970E0|nr:phage tail tube protein [Streptomyces sp. H27-C3]MDJ0462012.1 phage tail tube protein [Streptomyces sp. H27-C3]
MALDAAIGIGKETTYGTAATGTLGYEGKSDSWKTTREFIESVGFRAGMQTARADRRNIINMGGEGELEIDVLDAGAAALLAGSFDTYNGGIPNATTGLTTHVFETGSNSASPSFTAQMLRPTTDGKTVAYKHVGCVVTEWELTSEVENPVTLTATFDFQDVSHSDKPADALPIVYPDESYVYDWTRTAISLTIDGNAVIVDANKLELTGDRGMKVDRRFLRGNALKKTPVRAAMPTYEGTLEGEFTTEAVKLYEAFIGGKVGSLVIDFAGILPGTSMKIEAPAIQFTGDSPEASVDDVTVTELPFRVLDPGDGRSALKVTYVEPTPGFVPAK